MPQPIAVASRAGKAEDHSFPEHLMFLSAIRVELDHNSVFDSIVVAPRTTEAHHFRTLSAVIRPGGGSPFSNAVMFSSVSRAIASKARCVKNGERLVPGDDHIGEREHPREDVVLDHAVGKVLEEQVALFLVNVQPKRGELARLYARTAALLSKSGPRLVLTSITPRSSSGPANLRRRGDTSPAARGNAA